MAKREGLGTEDRRIRSGANKTKKFEKSRATGKGNTVVAKANQRNQSRHAVLEGVRAYKGKQTPRENSSQPDGEKSDKKEFTDRAKGKRTGNVVGGSQSFSRDVLIRRVAKGKESETTKTKEEEDIDKNVLAAGRLYVDQPKIISRRGEWINEQGEEYGWRVGVLGGLGEGAGECSL